MESKCVDIFLVGSKQNTASVFTSMLVYKTSCKMIQGIYPNNSLREVLVIGLIESLKLLKGSCDVYVNVLDNSFSKSINKTKYAKANQILKDSESIINIHNIHFLTLDISDPKRIVLDRVKRKSKSINSNCLPCIPLITSEKHEYFFRPKEVVTPSQTDDEYAYLSGLSSDLKDFVLNVIASDELNLYHSAAAFIQHRPNKPLDEIVDTYITKYSPKRRYLLDNETNVHEIFSYIYQRLKASNKLK